jgi:CBS domain-containing protein
MPGGRRQGQEAVTRRSRFANVVDAAAFLRRYPPFDALEEDELERVVAALETRSYPRGTDVLIEDGPPAAFFYVPFEGSAELVHEEEVIDVLEPGEGFGHMSLLTGLAPGFTVRARGDLSCYLVPAEQAKFVLGRLAGAGFVASTLRQWLVRTGQVVHGLTDLGTVHVVDLVSQRPVFCEPGTSISRAAALMTESGSSAVLIPTVDLLIVTDAIIRARVVAGPIGIENPVIRIAEPATVVEPTRLAVDAIVEMLSRDAEHVVVADGDNVLGVVSATDMLGLQSRSPFALRHAILHADGEDELVAVSHRLGRLFLALLDSGVSPPDIGRVLTLQYEALTLRLLELAYRRHGEPPAPSAWLLVGSAARRELTLGSDQENALAYADTTDPDVDAYFQRVATDVNAGLVRCGFEADANGVLAREELWRMSQADWEKTLASCFSSPDRSRLIRATVAFDFRQIAGALDVTPGFVAILRTAGEHPDFVRRLARTATDYRPPLGFRGALVTKGDDQTPAGTIDVKRGGMLPIVNLGRFHALTNRVTISATLDRLLAVEELGRLPHDEATALREAFEVSWRVRLAHHARQIEEGATPDNFVDPATLGPLEREELREALRAVVGAQKRLQVYLPPGVS